MGSSAALPRRHPDLVNAASSGKGYTALHQAAWHGAGIPVIRALLALDGSPRLMTRQHETAGDIGRDRHAERMDPHYVQTPTLQSPAQLLRKLVAETSGMFDSR